MPPKKSQSSTSGKKEEESKLPISSINTDLLTYNLDISESDSDNENTATIMKKQVKVPPTIKEDNVETKSTLSTKSKKGKTPVLTPTSDTEGATTDDEIKLPSNTKLTSAATTLSSSTTIESAGEEDEGSAVGSWTNRLKNNLHEYKTIRDFLKFLKQNYNGMDEHSIADIWDKLSSISMDEMEKLYSKSKKRDVKKLAKFQASGLQKPPRSGRDVFLKELTAKNKAANPPVKMTLAEQNAEWVKLSDSAKTKYVEMVEKSKQEYELAYQSQKTEAIKNGDFPEDAPKRPLNSYFRFRQDYLPLVKASLETPDYVSACAGKDEQEKKKIKSQLSKEYKKSIEDALKLKWDNLPAKKKEVYDTATAKDKEIYDKAIQAWKERSVSRQITKVENSN
jgi:hypothetical protein